MINAILSGAELMYIALQVPTYAFSLYGRPEVKEVSDLRGKILGVITKGASSDHASIALLRVHKMTQKDMKVLYFSRQQDALAALDKGIVNAAVLSAPTTVSLPGKPCSMHVSWMFAPSSTTIRPKSPRRQAQGPM